MHDDPTEQLIARTAADRQLRRDRRPAPDGQGRQRAAPVDLDPTLVPAAADLRQRRRPRRHRAHPLPIRPPGPRVISTPNAPDG
ncbi:MAG: hypothetical protein R2715_19500 [Ilumatobacteraceae bacterium]